MARNIFFENYTQYLEFKKTDKTGANGFENKYKNSDVSLNYIPEESTNTNCWNCLNCNYCENCVECKDCSYCRKCQYCEECVGEEVTVDEVTTQSYCVNCKNCKNCKNTTNCESCTSCNDCEKCINCDTCTSCKNCLNCNVEGEDEYDVGYENESSENCQNCSGIKNCKSCINCKHCDGCKKCSVCVSCNECDTCVKCNGCSICYDCNECDDLEETQGRLKSIWYKKNYVDEMVVNGGGSDIIDIATQTNFPIQESDAQSDFIITTDGGVNNVTAEAAAALVASYIPTGGGGDPHEPDFTEDYSTNYSDFSNFTGSGTEADPYQIWNEKMFLNARFKVNNGGLSQATYFKQMRDIVWQFDGYGWGTYIVCNTYLNIDYTYGDENVDEYLNYDGGGNTIIINNININYNDNFYSLLTGAPIEEISDMSEHQIAIFKAYTVTNINLKFTGNTILKSSNRYIDFYVFSSQNYAKNLIVDGLNFYINNSSNNNISFNILSSEYADDINIKNLKIDLNNCNLSPCYIFKGRNINNCRFIDSEIKNSKSNEPLLYVESNCFNLYVKNLLMSSTDEYPSWRTFSILKTLDNNDSIIKNVTIDNISISNFYFIRLLDSAFSMVNCNVGNITSNGAQFYIYYGCGDCISCNTYGSINFDVPINSSSLKIYYGYDSSNELKVYGKINNYFYIKTNGMSYDQATYSGMGNEIPLWTDGIDDESNISNIDGKNNYYVDET